MGDTGLDIRQANTIKPGSKRLEELEVALGTDTFKPTGLMIRLFLAFIKDDEERNPQTILRDELDSSYNLWYIWQATKPEFKKWWSDSLESIFTGVKLGQVHKAVLRRACQNSPQDAKLALERFDKQYKPTTAQEHRHSVAPLPDQDTADLAESSRKREVKRVESVVKDDVNPGQPND